MRIDLRKYVGIVLLVVGGLILFENIDILQGDLGKIISSAAYGLVAIFLFLLYGKSGVQWWWLVPGAFLAGLAIGNLFELIPAIEKFNSLVGVLAAGFAFLVIYLKKRTSWWTLIPGSLLISLGIIQFLEISDKSIGTNGIMFLGLGLAFLVVYLSPTSYGKLKWSLIPTLLLLAIGTVMSFDQGNNVFAYLGPLILLAGGGIVLFTSLRKR